MFHLLEDVNIDLGSRNMKNTLKCLSATKCPKPKCNLMYNEFCYFNLHWEVDQIPGLPIPRFPADS